MSDARTERVYQTAKGLAASMAQCGSSVDDLIALADGDRSVLEAARERAESEARQASERMQGAGSEEIPEAPALLAASLLSQALDEVERRQGPGET